MRAIRSYVRLDLERFLRALCRCDGLKDMAVVAALLFIAGALAVRLMAARQAVTSFS
ncbi:MAG: hypothetical protein H6Q88_3638 [Anaeromyxobacteraceae bacterium]|jgi:hypothetical protein|nr:hypothetical protein [Anaeromyxobacteraceae bacterium]